MLVHNYIEESKVLCDELLHFVLKQNITMKAKKVACGLHCGAKPLGMCSIYIYI